MRTADLIADDLSVLVGMAEQDVALAIHAQGRGIGRDDFGGDPPAFEVIGQPPHGAHVLPPCGDVRQVFRRFYGKRAWPFRNDRPAQGLGRRDASAHPLFNVAEGKNGFAAVPVLKVINHGAVIVGIVKVDVAPNIGLFVSANNQEFRAAPQLVAIIRAFGAVKREAFLLLKEFFEVQPNNAF